MLIPSLALAVLLSTTRYGLNLKGCCFRLQKLLPLWQMHQTKGRMMGYSLMSSDKSAKLSIKREKLEKRQRTKFYYALCLLLMLRAVWVEQQQTWLRATLVERSTTSHIFPRCPVVYTGRPQHTLTWNRYENVAFQSHLLFIHPKSAIFNISESAE